MASEQWGAPRLKSRARQLSSVVAHCVQDAGLDAPEKFSCILQTNTKEDTIACYNVLQLTKNVHIHYLL